MSKTPSTIARGYTVIREWGIYDWRNRIELFSDNWNLMSEWERKRVIVMLAMHARCVNE